MACPTTIQKGSSGSNVTTLQTSLRALGYNVVIDGAFGTQTDGAVRKYQSSKSLFVDGIVGPLTWGSLGKCTTTPPPPPPPPPTGACPPTIQIGSKGNDVTNLQTRLLARGYNLLIDGDFGSQTQGVVKQYQANNNLVVDGIVGDQTWTALKACDGVIIEPPQPPPPEGNSVIIDSEKYMKINGVRTFPLIMHRLCVGMGCDNNPQRCMTTPSQCAENLKYGWNIDLIGNDQTSVHQKSYETARKHFIAQLEPSSAAKNSPSFMGYYMPDEPKDPEYSGLLSTYKRIKQSDPNHIVMVGIYEDYETWKDIADVVICGLYPYKWFYINETGKADGRKLCNYIFEHLIYNSSGAGNLDLAEKPLYPVIQALGTTDEADVYVITEAELRALTYTAITMNVKGLSYYMHDMKTGFGEEQGGMGLSSNPTALAYYRKSVGELSSLSHVLLMPTLDYSWNFVRGTKVSISGGKDVDLWYRTYKNFNWILKGNSTNSYLIVVNKDTSSISNSTITISMPGLSGQSAIKTIGTYTTGSGRTGRSITMNNGSFTDSFDGLAVHIYQLDKVVSSAAVSPPIIDIPTPYVAKIEPIVKTAAIGLNKEINIDVYAFDQNNKPINDIPIVWTSAPFGIVNIDPISNKTKNGKTNIKITGMNEGETIINGTFSDKTNVVSSSINTKVYANPNHVVPPNLVYSCINNECVFDEVNGRFATLGECESSCPTTLPQVNSNNDLLLLVAVIIFFSLS
jgi:peptidoglycan hydrolase-like protein with peptidoglycan-binding domain